MTKNKKPEPNAVFGFFFDVSRRNAEFPKALVAGRWALVYKEELRSWIVKWRNSSLYPHLCLFTKAQFVVLFSLSNPSA